jgi:ATP-binding cassette subfamily B protein
MRAPFPAIAALVQPSSALRARNAVVGGLVGLTHVGWLLLTVLLVDLLLWDGQVSPDDRSGRAVVMELTGRTLVPGSPPVLNAGLLSSVLHSHGNWTEPALRWAYTNLRWTRTTNSYLVGLLGLAIILGLARLGLVFLQRRTIAGAAAAATARLQREVFLRDFSPAGGVDPSSGTRMAELLRHSIPTVERGLVARMELFPREPVRAAVLVVFAALVNLWLGATFVLIAVLAWLVGSIALREAVLRAKQFAVAHLRAVERLSGLAEKTRLIKGYAADEYFGRIYEERLAVSEQIDRRRLDFEAWFGPAWGLAGLAAFLALVGLASQNILADRLGLAGAAGVLASFLGIAWSGLEFFWRRKTLVDGEATAREIQRHLADRSDDSLQEGSEFLPPLKTAIEFGDVHYRRSGRPLLRGFSAMLPAGRRTAILSVDPEESRAAVDLLNRFIDPQKGAVVFDGRDVRKATFESLRAQVCLVLKDELLFPDTAAQNIGCGDPGFSRERIVEAAKEAHAHQFIERLPGGYDCVVGDQSRPLVIGERYRIGLARAILRDPGVVVIEEPDEPLDKDSAELIDDSLRRFLSGRTSLLIPTRWATLKIAEQVVIVDRGRAVVAGPHDRLFAEAPIYRYLLSTRMPDLPRTL